MYTKKYQDLTFTDDFMFCQVLENDDDLCKRLVELLLGVKIKEIRHKRRQHEIKPSPDRKSIKLDVKLDDADNTVFDLEMQRGHKKVLPKRSRYYQGLVDVDKLRAGASYFELPKSYIVFICSDFDPFDRGKHKYEFRELCVDDPAIELGDGTSKVFINALSRELEMSDEMRAFLDYLRGGEPASDLTRDIEARIVHAKQTREWEDSYMTFREYYAEEFQEALDENTAKVTEKVTAEVTAEVTEKVTKEVTDSRNHEMARDMLADGEPIEKIVKYSKLPRSEVEAIAAGMNQED